MPTVESVIYVLFCLYFISHFNIFFYFLFFIRLHYYLSVLGKKAILTMPEVQVVYNYNSKSIDRLVGSAQSSSSGDNSDRDTEIASENIVILKSHRMLFK